MKKTNNIQNNGFKTPENYFKNINDELQIRIAEEQLKKRFGNKNPFSVPENYFFSFSVNIKDEQKPERKIIQSLKPYFSIAAGIILIVGIWQILLTNIDNSETISNVIDTVTENNPDIFANNTLNFEDIDTTDLNTEVENIIYENDANSLIAFTEDNFDNYEIDVDDESISEYLIDYADDEDYEEILASL
ncbi:MAG: hypothetical protein L3J35_09785 [Bacteroidales bacterium]|nr:hypothetical protein [Bacteroidales bacterium]